MSGRYDETHKIVNIKKENRIEKLITAREKRTQFIETDINKLVLWY
jgi:hypothetical protein